MEQIAFRLWFAGVAIVGIVFAAGAARIVWLMLRAKPLTGGDGYPPQTKSGVV